MTSEGQRTLPADQAQASLRTELLGQLVAAQLALESAIAELSRAGGDAATLATAKSQLASLGDLRQQISTASIATLAAMRSEVAGVAAAAQASAQQTRDAATSAATTAVTDLAAKREAARQTIQSVTHDIFKRKIFDPYLQFASPGDEEAYRKRERENEAAIQRELARGTDKGNLRATELL